MKNHKLNDHKSRVNEAFAEIFKIRLNKNQSLHVHKEALF